MPDKFDPYREHLVVETETVWPEELAESDPQEQQRIADALHADPEACEHLEYIRMHSGFARRIVVTENDLERVGQ